jgi:two-component system KDP operon response regulator KdpE
MRALIIEDDPGVIETIRLCFELQDLGGTVISTSEGRKGIELVETGSPEIVILDLGLPDMDGLDALKQIREFSNVPIIILTVREDEMTKVKGLGLGADDYVVKPFSHIELLARVRAVLRRGHMPCLRGSEKSLVHGDLTIDFAAREVTRNGKPVHLTPTEWRLLTELVRNEGIVMTYESLLRRVWGDDYLDATQHVKKYVYRLRQKMGDDPELPGVIISVRGLGYKFVRPVS